MSANAPAIRHTAPMTAWTPTFAMSVAEAKAQVEMKRAFMKEVMRKDEHYGTIPGTPKASLWKPGAELLLSSMGLHCEVTVKESVRDYTGRDHNGEPFVEFLCTGTVYRQIGPTVIDRMVIAQADGLCNSWEAKYRWRNAKRRCPDCDAETIRENDEGFYCWRKIGGCGHKFQPGDDRITGQKLGLVKNPDIADLSNTILKIGGKRSYVAATLLATGCSDIFTQDLSDDDDPPGGDTDTPGGTERRSNGNGRSSGGRRGGPSGSSLTAEQEAELRELNEQLGDRKWSPAILNAKLGRPYEVTKAELDALMGGAKPPAAAAGEESARV
jgi:hypothetical protein